MKVALIVRKSNGFFFSIENVFKAIYGPLASKAAISFLELRHIGFSIKGVLGNFKYLQNKPFDVFHVTGDVHYMVFALPRSKTVLTIHDCVFVRQTSGVKKLIIKKLFLDWPVRYTKYITTISEKSKAEIIALTGCKPERIQVIPNPLSPYIYFSGRSFNAGNPTILFLGSTPNKNLERVLESLKNIPCNLHIIGKLNSAQLETVHASGIKHVVESGLTDPELADRYANADMILFPSLYEGFGLPIIEGFKAGKVVVTSNLSPMKEVAENAACLVDPNSVDSIRGGVLKVISDEDYRQQLIQRGKEVVKQYSAENIASQYFQLYRKVYDKQAV